MKCIECPCLVFQIGKALCSYTGAYLTDAQLNEHRHWLRHGKDAGRCKTPPQRGETRPATM